MITACQIRSARAALGWSARDLADRTSISLRTIMRIEQHDGVPPSRAPTLLDIQRGLEAAGIEFIGTPDEGPGIRYWRR